MGATRLAERAKKKTNLSVTQLYPRFWYITHHNKSKGSGGFSGKTHKADLQKAGFRIFRVSGMITT